MNTTATTTDQALNAPALNGQPQTLRGDCGPRSLGLSGLGYASR